MQDIKIKITIQSSTDDSYKELVLTNIIENDLEVLLRIGNDEIYVLRESLKNAVAKF